MDRDPAPGRASGAVVRDRDQSRAGDGVRLLLRGVTEAHDVGAQHAAPLRSTPPRIYRRLRVFANSLRISRYSQISVTIRPNAPYHSMYLGAPPVTPVSMKSKSRIRFNAATITITPLTTRLVVLVPCRNGIAMPKNESPSPIR